MFLFFVFHTPKGYEKKVVDTFLIIPLIFPMNQFLVTLFSVVLLAFSAHAAYITVNTEYGPVTGIHDAYARSFRVL